MTDSGKPAAPPDPLRLRAVVTRHHPGFPRLIVIPAALVERWGLAGTTTVEGTLAGCDLGRRSLKRWDAERWWIDLPERLCRKAGVEVGDRVEVVLRLASTELPEELARLLEEDPAARACWGRLTPGRRRIVREDVAAARRPDTRERRAARALLGASRRTDPS